MAMTHVLVVDDSGPDRLLVGGLLRKDSELTVDFAENGIAALEKMDRCRPDLVVTDLIMPEMDGLELVSAVRNRFPQVPTVLMTSKGSEEIAVKALQRGAASYVPKRVLADELVSTVRDLLELTQKQRNQTRLMACLAENRASFELENDRRLLSSLVGYLQELVAHLGLCEEADRMRVGVALEEALVNALYHGNLEVSSELREEDHDAYQALADRRASEPPYSQRRIHVRANLSRAKAEFVITDEGPGFDPDSLPDPTDPANLEKVSGRGVLLMRTFMDSVQYNDLGNEVSLVKFGDAEAD